jgi:hypothetical protein
MTIDGAVFAAGSILVAVVVWQTHRLTSRRLSEIQNGLDGLRELTSRVFVMGLNPTLENTVASEAEPVPEHGDKARSEGTPARSPDVEIELSEVDLLCAKLITLAPPSAALPLLTERESNVSPPLEDREARRDGRERLRAWPQR